MGRERGGGGGNNLYLLGNHPDRAGNISVPPNLF